MKLVSLVPTIVLCLFLSIALSNQQEIHRYLVKTGPSANVNKPAAKPVFNTKGAKKKMGNNASADTQAYLDHYPDDNYDDKTANTNLRFFKNEIRSKPSGNMIDVIHETWRGDYDLLEQHHGYIQWLFPIRENGMNGQAQKLLPHEIQAIGSDPALIERLLRSYALMLDFYGMQLDPSTKKISRAAHYKERYRHLNKSFHNYLRITRILKCLGELQCEEYKYHFVRHVWDEIQQGQLPNCLRSLTDFWIPVLRDEQLKQKLLLEIQAAQQQIGKGKDGGGGGKPAGAASSRLVMGKPADLNTTTAVEESEEERESEKKGLQKRVKRNSVTKEDDEEEEEEKGEADKDEEKEVWTSYMTE